MRAAGSPPPPSASRSAADSNDDTDKSGPAGWVGFVVFGAIVVAIAMILIFLIIRQSIINARRARHTAMVRTDPESARRHLGHASTTTSSNSIPLHRHRSAVQSLDMEPGRTYKQLRADGSDAEIPPNQCGSSVECVICLEGFQDQSLVRKLPCHHLFHAECIARWFRKHHDTCPICMAHHTGSNIPQERALPAPPPPVLLPF